uniref:Uncharacterized protein n=1 Tax=viral metagenome TaxID=1070528 RepID=A0A6C0KNH0_9ZZZZ
MNIFFIKLLKKLNVWNSKFKDGEDIYNNFFLIENGYTCDLELSLNNKYIVVYYNKNNKKLLVYFDGIDSVFINYLEKFDLFTCKKLLDEYLNRVEKTVNIINQKYKDCKKLYLGYCLGGYMVNNYVFGENITAYTYNSWGIKHTNNNIQVTNYCEQLDFHNFFWKFDHNTININSHSKLFIDQLFNINKIDITKFTLKLHSIFTVDEKNIVIEF